MFAEEPRGNRDFCHYAHKMSQSSSSHILLLLSTSKSQEGPGAAKLQDNLENVPLAFYLFFIFKNIYLPLLCLKYLLIFYLEERKLDDVRVGMELE